MTTSLSRPSLLYLVHRVPYPPDKGDRIRTFQFLRYLAQRFDVHLACLADEPVSAECRTALERLCKRVAIVSIEGKTRWLRALASLCGGRTITEGAFSSRAFRRILAEWAGQHSYDVILASSSSMAPYLRLPQLAETPAVVDLIDVDSQKWFDYAGTVRWPKSWVFDLEGRRLRRLETGLAERARAITLVSEAEAALYRRFSQAGHVQAVGNGVDLGYFRPREAKEQGCVFLGALDYWPNVEGISWFCKTIWPEIRKRKPEASLSIVGRRPCAQVLELAGMPGVKLVGSVPDVRPYLASAAVSLVPLRIARGIQNKVLESMAMGKATVVSPQALEGLKARPEVHLISATDAQRWIEAICRLFDSPASRKRLGTAARSFAEEHHDWQRCLAPLDELLGLADEGRPHAQQSISAALVSTRT